MDLHVEVDYSGPIFDGRADDLTQRACDRAQERIATIGASMIRSELAAVLRNETPFYRMRNEATPDAPGWKIWDNNVIYGNWLEGTGSRNFPATRFRGYFTYRRTFQAIERRAQAIAEYTINEFIPGMNA